MNEQIGKVENFSIKDPEIVKRKTELARLGSIETYKTTPDPVTAGNAEKLRQDLMARHRKFINENETKDS